jgi:hypothetical protein
MIAIRNHSLRNAVFAGAALLGTALSFGMTTQPVHAASQQTYYTAALATPLAAPRQVILRGVLWNCAGDACTAARDVSRDVNVCARLVKKVGPVAAFSTPRGALAAEELARCNAGE